MSYAVPAPVLPSLSVAGSDARYPVRRIFCVGRNFADHAREMGATVDRAQPMFFCKPADAVVTEGADVPYPSATSELHHEVEMVVALGGGGRDIDAERVRGLIFGYGVGLDLTRRDLQAQAKAKGHPWDVAKAFDCSAPVSALRPATLGHPGPETRLTLTVNGQLRQQGTLGSMVYDVATLVAALSGLFELKPGDLIFTGTPAGVAPLQRGDRFHAALEGFATLDGRIV